MDPVPISLLLDKLARAGAARLQEALKPLGLRPAHAGLLYAAARLDRPSQQQLASWLGVGASLVVGLVDELVAADLVTREREPGDRRRSSIVLTDAGRQTVRSVEQAMRTVDDAMLDSFPAAERASLTEAIARLAGAQGIAAS